jgi:hypothetical protein
MATAGLPRDTCGRPKAFDGKAGAPVGHIGRGSARLAGRDPAAAIVGTCCALRPSGKIAA